MYLNSNPWIFGDEYIYISKARNLKFGIDVLADTTIGHSYPPLYSYLLSLVIGNDPVSTYRNIQILNFFSSQFILLISFYFLNKTYDFTKQKNGFVYLIFSYFGIASLSTILGYNFVAMSENLFIPLVFLIFSLTNYLLSKNKINYKLLFSIALLISCSILTRTIGIILIPVFLLSMLPSFIKSKNTKKIFLDSVLFLFFSIIPYLIFKKVENLFTPSTIQEISGDYDSLFKAYVGVIKDFFLGKNNFFISLKVIGNHIIYLFFSTFFLPFLFIINDFVEFVKSKKIKGELIFVLTSSLLFFIPSYLHDYLGFFRNEIKYSTYFRYADASIIIMIAYSLIRLFEVTKNKLKIYKNSYFLYFFISMILTLFLPVRDFYVTINSLGWTWLDIFKQNALIIKIISLLLLSIFLFFIKYKKYNLFLLSIIILNLFSIFPILKMNTWLSTNKENLALEHTISNILSNNKKIPFYIDKNNTKDDSFVGPIYYGKYFLLFNSNEKIPIKPINIKELNGKKQFVFLGKSKDDIFNIYNFNEVISISENLKIGIIYENK